MKTKEKKAQHTPKGSIPCERCAGINVDLLAACEEAACWLREYITQLGNDPMDQGMVDLHNELRAAIAKATK